MDLKEFAEQLVSLSVKDVNELAAILKEEHGIEPAAAAAVAVAGPAAAGGDAAGDEKTEFDVVLKSAGAAKLQVVKVGGLKKVLPRGLSQGGSGLTPEQWDHPPTLTASNFAAS